MSVSDGEAASKVVLGPEASSEYFDIGGTIQSTNTSMYINIGDDATSYRTLTFGETGSTTEWGLEGDTIITTEGSSFGRREFPMSLPALDLARMRLTLLSLSATELNFLACELDGGYWDVYLQTGSDAPSGTTCSNYQTLHLPCLC